MVLILKLAACLMVAAAYGVGLWLYPVSIFTFLLSIPVCNFLAVACHELGHYLAYRLLGLSWKKMVISCFLFRQGQGLQLDLRQRIFAGSCTCAYDPRVPYWRYCIALLSGSLSGLLIAAAALLGWHFTGSAFLLSFGIMNGLHGLYNLLVPFSTDRLLLKQIKEERENMA